MLNFLFSLKLHFSFLWSTLDLMSINFASCCLLSYTIIIPLLYLASPSTCLFLLGIFCFFFMLKFLSYYRHSNLLFFSFEVFLFPFVLFVSIFFLLNIKTIYFLYFMLTRVFYRWKAVSGFKIENKSRYSALSDQKWENCENS